jgi:hypothetical protein
VVVFDVGDVVLRVTFGFCLLAPLGVGSAVD